MGAGQPPKSTHFCQLACSGTHIWPGLLGLRTGSAAAVVIAVVSGCSRVLGLGAGPARARASSSNDAARHGTGTRG